MIIDETVFEEVLEKLYEELKSIKLIIYELDKDLALRLINDIERLQVDKCIVQVLPSTVVASYEQLLLASLLTFKSLKDNKAVCRKTYMEFLVRLFSNRHVGKLIKKLQEVSAPKYLLITSCVGEIVAPTIGEELKLTPISSHELIRRYKMSTNLNDLLRIYDLAISNELNHDLIHKLILSKIALSYLL